MLHYEVLMLTTPTITQDETKEVESGIERVVKAAGGTIVSFDRWGKYHLAYPVKKNEYGIYYLARFDVESAETVLPELRLLFVVKLHEIVMRHMVTALEPDAPSVYLRPQSLEEAPEQSESGLSKRNIERIITTSESRKSVDLDSVADTQEATAEGTEELLEAKVDVESPEEKPEKTEEATESGDDQ